MILVVGGAGYIGSHTVQLLNKQNRPVVVFDNLSTGHIEFIPNNIPFVKGDLNSDEDLDNVFTQYPNIDTVLHFAAFAYVGESVSEPSKHYQNNVVNTLRLLDAMKKYNVLKIVFSSTCATYGNPIQLPITETHPQQPINPYGRTKWMIEQIMEDYHLAYGMQYVALRYFNAAGANPEAHIGEWHDPETHLIPLILDAAVGKREYITVFGDDYDTPDGTCIRDYIYVRDLADAYLRAVDCINLNQECHAINLGNGKGSSVLEMIKTAEKITGRQIPTVISERRPGDPAILVGSVQKAFELLNWQPIYSSMESIISTAWKWHQKRIGVEV